MAQDRSSSPDARSLGSITPERITLRPEREEPEPRLSSHTSRVRDGATFHTHRCICHLLRSRVKPRPLCAAQARAANPPLITHCTNKGPFSLEALTARSRGFELNFSKSVAISRALLTLQPTSSKCHASTKEHLKQHLSKQMGCFRAGVGRWCCGTRRRARCER
uniref:Uncharacterized protein n=1 Tax=Knipowitschia caucasica TaxID=637954 RepID=A0AAV2L891_KNICA